MKISINLDTVIEIKTLEDLATLKLVMEQLKMKINKSQLARDLGCDRRTIDKYLDGYTPKKRRERKRLLDEFYPTIAALLSEGCIQKFYYKRVLWQYLKDNHGLACGASTFRAYIAETQEFEDYFTHGKKIPTPKGTPRYETPGGKQAQLDWKEKIRYVDKDGEVHTFYIGVLILSSSRMRKFQLTTSTAQCVLMNFMTETFEEWDGVPEEVLSDNMKTVMDEARTEHHGGRINNRFAEFAKAIGFKVKPCIAGRPRTKGKVETTMKLLEEIHAYQGKLSVQELHTLVKTIEHRVNHQIHQGTGRIPALEFKKEKNLLHQLPTVKVRDSYRIKKTTALVNSSNMVTYKQNQYSVPPGWGGKRVDLQVYDNQLWIYYNMEIIAYHTISENKLNYQESHYLEALRLSMPNYPDITKVAKENLKTLGGLV